MVNVMGDDLSVVNAARVSYDKESGSFSDNDERLLDFLIREGHTSVLRHQALTFEGYAPLLVARQWYKHTIAATYIDDQNGWNESSRRYITENEEFYLPGPGDWRSKPENSKQGSGENLDPEVGFHWTNYLESFQAEGEKLYKRAMEAGIAPEQARLFLLANGLYVRFRWTTSLAATLNFLSQRTDSHAQYEIQQYAGAIEGFVEGAFPLTYRAFQKYEKDEVE